MVTGDTVVKQLENTSCEKDIGELIDSKLYFDSHILAAVKRANSRMGVIRRTFLTLNKGKFPLLFKAIVRPHLEYASSVWGPHQKRQIQLLEDVQRRLTKLLPEFHFISFSYHLRRVGGPSANVGLQGALHLPLQYIN